MFTDLTTSELRELNVDVCLVGAGPAGIALALQMSGSGLKVCLAEGGGLTEEPSTHALFAGESTGHPINLLQGRHRVFGGSVLTWGGRCAELDPIDLEARDWVPRSGWPISWEVLQKFYARARTNSNFVGDWTSNADDLATVGRVLPELAGNEIRPFVWRFAPPKAPRATSDMFHFGPRPPFQWSDAYEAKLRAAEDVEVVVHANLVSLDPTQNKASISAARFSSLTGRTLRVQAKVFVLCCGGIENTRMLLNLREKLGARMHGERHVGKSFAQHPRGTILTIDAGRETAHRLQKVFDKFTTRTYGSIQYEVGVALTESAQREHKLLNASGAFQYLPSERSAWLAGKRLRDALHARRLHGEAARDLRRLIVDGVLSVPNAARKYVTGTPLKFPDGVLRVVIDLEQPPRLDSTVTLTHERDALGVRKVAIDWKIGELERTTARIFAGFVARELRRLDFGRPRLARWLTSTAPISDADLAGNYHFIGATRMADSPAEGVVDPNLLVHGLQNLYVCGCSVFPTGGHANPTLTIVALAIRLGDHLRHLLCRRQLATAPRQPSAAEDLLRD